MERKEKEANLKKRLEKKTTSSGYPIGQHSKHGELGEPAIRALIKIFHRATNLFSNVPIRLFEQYRKNDGRHGSV